MIAMIIIKKKKKREEISNTFSESMIKSRIRVHSKSGRKVIKTVH